jgi:hypothetical protein
MSRLRKPSELRRVLLGFALALVMAVSARAYEASQFATCAAACGPCAVIAYGCDSCESGSGEGGCFAQGINCAGVECDCGGDPNWECYYYEY